MIYRSFYESDIADSYQGPSIEDIGNDLQQIEDEIMSSHDDEVSDATEGVLGDPIEECFMAIYESEYNYNQLLEAIGYHKLKCAYNGQRAILESGDGESFIDKVIRIIKNIWAKIVEFFKKIWAFLVNIIRDNKKFADKNEAKIRAGYEKMPTGKEAPKGYNYNFGGVKYNDISRIEKLISKADAKENIKNLSDEEFRDALKDADDKAHTYEENIYSIFGNNTILGIVNVNEDIKTISDLKDAIISAISGDDKVDLKANVYTSANTLLDVLRNKVDVVDKVDKVYKETKVSTANMIKELEALRSRVSKLDSKDKSTNIKNINKTINIRRYHANVLAAVNATIGSLAKKHVSQARSYAISCIAKVSKKDMDTEKGNDDTFYAEEGANLFTNITII